MSGQEWIFEFWFQKDDQTIDVFPFHIADRDKLEEIDLGPSLCFFFHIILNG